MQAKMSKLKVKEHHARQAKMSKLKVKEHHASGPKLGLTLGSFKKTNHVKMDLKINHQHHNRMKDLLLMKVGIHHASQPNLGLVTLQMKVDMHASQPKTNHVMQLLMNANLIRFQTNPVKLLVKHNTN